MKTVKMKSQSSKKKEDTFKLLSKYGTFLNGLICLIATFYLVGISFLHYVANNDASAVNTRKYNSRSMDVYPTYTLCLVDDRAEKNSFKHHGMYRTGYIAANRGISWPNRSGGRKAWHKYRDFLRGNENVDKLKGKERQIMSEIDFTRVTKPLAKYMKRIEVAERFEKDLDSQKEVFGPNITSIDRNNPENRSTYESMLYLSHQSPNTLCYTRKSSYTRNHKRVYEKLTFLALEVYKKSISDIFLYVHHPGQFHRRKIQALRINVYYGEHTVYYFNRKYDIEIITTDIFRKRTDAIENCNKEIDSDDDRHWIKGGVEILKCIPPFWKAFYEWQNSTFSTCKTPEQFQKVTKVLQRDEEQAGYTQPCAEMSVGVVQSEYKDNQLISQKHQEGTSASDSGKLTIILKYPKSTYHEILNRREITFDSFWSSTGGFVGMFLGYSVMQVPQIIFVVVKWFMNQKS